MHLVGEEAPFIKIHIFLGGCGVWRRSGEGVSSCASWWLINEGDLSLVLVRTPLKTTARNLAKSENFLM